MDDVWGDPRPYAAGPGAVKAICARRAFHFAHPANAGNRASGGSPRIDPFLAFGSQ